jgi:CheY-like chemotaxis protein
MNRDAMKDNTGNESYFAHFPDGNATIARLLVRKFILEEHPGWIVEEATTGEEALDKVRAGVQPSLFIIDVNMPGMGGIAAAERLRNACPGVPISLLTVNVHNATRCSANELGIGFMEKPITAERIARILSVLDEDRDRAIALSAD